MTRVRIADLLASSPVDPTAHLDPDRVRRYVELPGDLPPVVAFRTDQGLILADGYHRVAAAQARGLDTIEVEVRDGSAHDALHYAVTVGATQRGLSQQEVMRRLRQRSGGRWGQAATAGSPLAEQLGRVGLWTSKLDLQPADQLRGIFTELEALGWGSLWSWEVFGREALTNAGLLLCTSQQLVVGTGIANIWARDPVAMAAAQRTLAEAYPGRFVLGLGVSHAPIVDARGHRYERPLERMRAYLDAMDTAPWQGPPLKEEPVRVLAALGPRMLELAAERSAGALTYNAAPEATAWARSILGPGPLLAVEQAVVVEQDPATARGIARELLAFYLTLPNYVRAWERAGFGPEELADGGSDRLVDAVVAWGSPEAIAERVTAHLEAGADHVCLQVLDPDPNALPMAACRALAPVLLGR